MEDYALSLRRQRLKEHVTLTMCFVIKYCLLHQTDRVICQDFVKTYYFLPDFFKEIVIKYVHKTLEDTPLIESLSLLVQCPHRVDIALRGFADAFRNEFNDHKVIEWVSMVCTVSDYLYQKGFKKAIHESIETINTICNYYRRYDAFAYMGCDV